MIALFSLSEHLSTIQCESGWDNFCLDAIDHAWWGIAIEVIMLLYAFIGLAIICDEYLVPSLETLCVRWNVREDVAGATLLAAGSSAPELIINAVTTIQGSDNVELGVGAIIGSGMIAFMVIPSACSLLAGSDTPIQVKRRPLLRDILFYTVALVLLCLFFSDGIITIMEASILVGLYVVYVITVIVAPKIRVWHKMRQLPDEVARSKFMLARSVSFVERAQVEARSRAVSVSTSSRATVSNKASESLLSHQDSFLGNNGFSDETYNPVIPTPEPSDKPQVQPAKRVIPPKINFDAPPTFEEADAMLISSYGSVNDDKSRQAAEQRAAAINAGGELIIPPSPSPSTESDDEDDEATYNPILGEEEEEEEPSCIGRIIEIMSAPLALIFKYTCPQAKLESPWEGYYPLGFLISIVWVAFFSCVISAVVGRFVTLSGVSMAFVGLVLVAFGAEIPDIVQSMSVAKKGYGSMAVSNCIGAQITNILMGLGFPWLLSILIRGQNILIVKHSTLFTASVIQLCNVAIFTVLMLVFAIILGHNKVQLSTWKAKLNLFLYFVSLGVYAYFIFR